MKHRIATIAMLAIAMLMGACSTPKRQAYIMDAPRNVAMPINQSYVATVMPGDRLQITVASQAADAASFFNRGMYLSVPKGEEVKETKGEWLGYEVNNAGNIVYPQLGEIHVVGMSVDSLGHYIARRLRDEGYVNDAQVTVQTTNFSVAVIGEVAQPSEVHSTGQRLTIFEALAYCGDITMDAMPEYTTVVRQTMAGQIVDTIDLTSQSMFSSPCYYLQQNDIVFVPPTKKKQRTAYRDEDWPTYLQIGVSAVTFAYLTVYRLFFDWHFIEMRQQARNANN